MPGPRAPLLANQMKPILPLLVVSLVPLLSITGPALPRQYSDYGGNPYLSDIYLDRSAYGAGYGPYGDHSLDLGVAADVYLPREIPEWTYGRYRSGPYQAPRQEPYSEQPPSIDYLPYRSPGERVGSPRESVVQPGTPQLRPFGYTRAHDRSARGVSSGSYAPGPANGFGFRDNGLGGPEGWGAPPWRQGYRFRPLTEQERKRMDNRTGWRPRVANPGWERFRGADPMPAEEAFGYQPDSWFQRYYELQR